MDLIRCPRCKLSSTPREAHAWVCPVCREPLCLDIKPAPAIVPIDEEKPKPCPKSTSWPGVILVFLATLAGSWIGLAQSPRTEQLAPEQPRIRVLAQTREEMPSPKQTENPLPGDGHPLAGRGTIAGRKSRAR